MAEQSGAIVYLLLPLLAGVLALAWVAWLLRKRSVSMISLRGLGIELHITTTQKENQNG